MKIRPEELSVLLAQTAAPIAAQLLVRGASIPARHEEALKKAEELAFELLVLVDKRTKELGLASPRRFRTRFTVRGSGEFPFDMLRYAECFPWKESEARRLNIDVMDAEYNVARTVDLIKYHTDRRPHLAEDRWQSMGWAIDSYGETEEL